jgi:hypothetical protein
VSVDPWGNDTTSTSITPGTSLFQASVVIDVLLDARAQSGEPWQRERIDELLVPLSNRRLMTPDEVTETMAALEGLDGTRPRRPRRLGHNR